MTHFRVRKVQEMDEPRLSQNPEPDFTLVDESFGSPQTSNPRHSGVYIEQALSRSAIMISLLTLLAVASVISQRPSGVSMCDYYTNIQFPGNNTELTQYLFMKMTTNRIITGSPADGVYGLADVGTFQGQNYSQIQFFNGSLATSNVNGVPTFKNFLDGGGLAPIYAGGNPSNDWNTTMSSAQYGLVVHAIGMFGALLGCSKQGGAIFPPYSGRMSMYETHQFMNIPRDLLNYHMTQIVGSYRSYNFSLADQALAMQLINGTFGSKCSPNVTISQSLAPAVQSICTGTGCALDPAGPCAVSLAVAPKSGANPLRNSAILAIFAVFVALLL